MVVKPSSQLDGEISSSLSQHTPTGVAIAACSDDTEGLAGAIHADAPADVVLVALGCEVGAGWLERLQEAAYAERATATASALESPELLGGSGTLELGQAAAQVAAAALALRPRIAAPRPSCVFIRREALELVGPFDGDFAVRCLACGLAHVLADDVLVDAPPGWVRADRVVSPALARGLGAARRAVRDLALTIDARVLRGPMTGTHVHVLELIGAVVAAGEANVSALLPQEPAPHALEALQALPELTVLRERPGEVTVSRADLVHRPFQVDTPADLAVLAQLGERLLITHQDLIGYHNPSYFRSEQDWLSYRELTQASLAVADHVAFFSDYVRNDALAEDLIEPHRGAVVRLGVDHALTGRRPPVAPTAAVRIVEDRPAMLCLGTDLRHKNRLFALRILEQLCHRHRWPGVLLLAGPSVDVGSSRPEEGAFLDERPDLAGAVLDLGAVGEAEKAWLLGRVDLVLYPSVLEGFGLVPFEAAQHGTACLWAAGSSLSEVLPEDAAGIVRWDAAASAEQALALMHSGAARAAHLDQVRHAAQSLRWRDTAARLHELYRLTCDAPPSPAGARERAAGVMRRGISEDAMRLVGPGGALPSELVRPLLALATRRGLSGPVFAMLKAGYAASAGRRRRASASRHRD